MELALVTKMKMQDICFNTLHLQISKQIVHIHLELTTTHTNFSINTLEILLKMSIKQVHHLPGTQINSNKITHRLVTQLHTNRITSTENTRTDN